MTSTLGKNKMIASLALIVWIVLPCAAWIIHRRRYPTAKGLFFSVIGSLIIGYTIYVGTVWAVDQQYQWELDQFDLDGDNSFSSDEYTPEAQAAMKRVTNDTGRTFAPIVAAPVTLIWFTINFTFLYFGSKIFRFFKIRFKSPLK